MYFLFNLASNYTSLKRLLLTQQQHKKSIKKQGKINKHTRNGQTFEVRCFSIILNREKRSEQRIGVCYSSRNYTEINTMRV